MLSFFVACAERQESEEAKGHSGDAFQLLWPCLLPDGSVVLGNISRIEFLVLPVDVVPLPRVAVSGGRELITRFLALFRLSTSLQASDSFFLEVFVLFQVLCFASVLFFAVVTGAFFPQYALLAIVVRSFFVFYFVGMQFLSHLLGD